MNPRKPTELKLLQGTFRGDRVAKNEPKPELAIPPCPKHLSKEAKKEWHRLGKELLKLGLLTRIDRAAFAAYCETWSDWVEATKMCATTPEGQDKKVLRTDKGNFVENPYFSIKKRTAELMHKFLIEFGMTPASRPGINASPLADTTNPKNPFSQLG